MTRKKIINDDTKPDSLTPEPVAEQTHVVTTKYKKQIPVRELEQPEETDQAETTEPENYFDDADENEIDLRPRFFPTIEPPPNASDSIAQMLADLQIEKRSHSWTMVIERLPNYERDGRNDVGAKRVNCGTRAMSEDFIEEIRREFARPNKVNNFRVTIKRDGKIFAHWPDVICLEPPAPDELPALDAQFSPPVPAPVAPMPSTTTGFTDLVKQLKQLRELQTLLTPEPTPNPGGTVTEEAALLRLLSSSDEVIQKVTERISKKLFRDDQPQEGAEWLPLLKAAIDNGPAMITQLFQGIQQLRYGAPALPEMPMQTQFIPNSPPLPPPVSPQQMPPPVETGLTPDLVLLGNVIRYMEINAPVEAAATFVDAYTEQHPELNPLIESFLAMSADDCRAFMKTFFPNAAGILDQPNANDWIANLQRRLTSEDQN